MKTISCLLYLIVVFCFGGIDIISASENVATEKDAALTQRIEKFAKEVLGLREKVGEVYLVIGEKNCKRSEAEIEANPKPYGEKGSRNERRFGADNWTFMDYDWNETNTKRIGIKGDIADLEMFKQLSAKLPGAFSIILDDWALLQGNCAKRKETVDEIHKLLGDGGMLIANNPFGSKQDADELFRKFKVYRSSNILECSPYGGGLPSAGSIFRYGNVIEFLVWGLYCKLDVDLQNEIWWAYNIIVKTGGNNIVQLKPPYFVNFRRTPKYEEEIGRRAIQLDKMIETEIIPDHFRWTVNNILGSAMQIKKDMLLYMIEHKSPALRDGFFILKKK
ncbi:hypothetical protein FACS189449_01660 [Alphaproteobacteria bacterium]|nr:hypothetical protein FACS189449_01660 [Alphaproteobacteria bacterium]